MINGSFCHKHLYYIVYQLINITKGWSYLFSGHSGIILCARPANERQRYIVTSSLIAWAHTQNDLWDTYFSWVTGKVLLKARAGITDSGPVGGRNSPGFLSISVWLNLRAAANISDWFGSDVSPGRRDVKLALYGPHSINRRMAWLFWACRSRLQGVEKDWGQDWQINNFSGWSGKDE